MHPGRKRILYEMEWVPRGLNLHFVRHGTLTSVVVPSLHISTNTYRLPKISELMQTNLVYDAENRHRYHYACYQRHQYIHNNFETPYVCGNKVTTGNVTLSNNCAAIS